MLRRLSQDQFFRHNVIFFIGSLMVAFLNYLYHPVMSRMLSVEAFGEVQTVFSLIFLFSVLLTVFNRLVVYIEVNGTRTQSTLPALFTAFCTIHIPLVVILALCSPFLSRFFSFSSSYDFAILAVYLLLSLPLSLLQAKLQAQKRFGSLSLSQAVFSLGKIIFGLVLVYIGLDTAGAIGGLVVAIAITILYTIYSLTHTSSSSSTSDGEHSLISLTSLHVAWTTLRQYGLYALTICVGFLFVTALYSLDVVLAKRLFDPEVAGLYSGIATIARIIFFLTISVSAVVISAVSIHASKESNLRVLKKALLFITLLGFPVLLLFSFAPSFIVTTLLGSAYLPLSPLLPYTALFLFFVSYVNVFMYYLLSFRSYVLIPISVVGCLVVGGFLLLDSSGPAALVKAFSSGAVCSLVLLALYSFRIPANS